MILRKKQYGYNISEKPIKFYIMKNAITGTTRLLLQGTLTKYEADKILLDLYNVSENLYGIVEEGTKLYIYKNIESAEEKIIEINKMYDVNLEAVEITINNNTTNFDISVVGNSALNKCVELFDNLTPTERLIVMDKICLNCGNIKEGCVCKKCDSPM